MARGSLPGMADESYDALLTCDQVLLSEAATSIARIPRKRFIVPQQMI